jgi:hypothetical protein
MLNPGLMELDMEPRRTNGDESQGRTRDVAHLGRYPLHQGGGEQTQNLHFSVTVWQCQVDCLA